jgi:NAD(P)-dependent dehydrogenase (short-subunit alcohol dehydrogenase family)
MNETENISESLSEEDIGVVCSIAPALRMLYSPDGGAVCAFFTNDAIKKIDGAHGEPVLFFSAGDDIREAFSAHATRYGRPRIAAARGLGAFALGEGLDEASDARRAFARSSGVGDKMFAGSSSRRGAAARGEPRIAGGRAAGKIVVVTGSAQGFGRGIAKIMASAGAYVISADLNLEGAEACAAEIEETYGAGRSEAVRADVSDEISVRDMVRAAVLNYGGLDVMISNAGIAIAGSLAEMTRKKFDLVTGVNYAGYFLCAKHASSVMKIQREYSPAYTADIIEINSKSGLEGSDKNFAYAGSKFGGIGLTQSFALEMAPFGVKVNAICPGNYLDGPLWSDPERGLFRQYFEAGKAPGAKSAADVRAFYESKVPMKRGCTPEDVVHAILYAIEQQYETGQAIPVTGGQVMLS